MKQLKPYMDKVEAMLLERMNKKGKRKQTGLLSSSSSQSATPVKKTPIELVADYVEGIREARAEMLKGMK